MPSTLGLLSLHRHHLVRLLAVKDCVEADFVVDLLHALKVCTRGTFAAKDDVL